MPFSIAAAGIGAAGSIAGGMMQSSNASKAGAQAQRNLQLMLPQMQENYVNTLAQYQPYAGAGQEGLTATTDLLGLNGPDAAKAAMDRFQTSPGYQFQMEQGLRGIDAGAASKGILRSGATIKAEDEFSQNLANLDFGNYYNRLSALSGQGLTAASGVAAAGNNLIAGMQGNAQSQNAVALGGANAQNSILGNTAQGLGSTVNNLFSDKNFQGWAKGLFGPSTGDLSGYGQTASSYATAPGFMVGDATQDPNSYWR